MIFYIFTSRFIYFSYYLGNRQVIRWDCAWGNTTSVVEKQGDFLPADTLPYIPYIQDIYPMKHSP